MKWMLALLLVLLAGLQYRLWWGEGSFAHTRALEQQLGEQSQRNQALFRRNEALSRDVMALRDGTDAMEEAARTNLGLIAPGETFYLIVDEPSP